MNLSSKPHKGRQTYRRDEEIIKYYSHSSEPSACSSELIILEMVFFLIINILFNASNGKLSEDWFHHKGDIKS
jgi:hypothetical protein